MFFSSGGHVTRDLPNLLEELRASFPALEIEMAGPIGEQPGFADFVSRVVRSELDGIAGENDRSDSSSANESKS
jgi:sirohydrochlorin ferrochelatase